MKSNAVYSGMGGGGSGVGGGGGSSGPPDGPHSFTKKESFRFMGFDVSNGGLDAHMLGCMPCSLSMPPEPEVS